MYQAMAMAVTRHSKIDESIHDQIRIAACDTLYVK